METRKGGRLIDRPEFKSKPQPVTFLGKTKVADAITVMADKNYGCVVIVDDKDKVLVLLQSLLKMFLSNGTHTKWF